MPSTQQQREGIKPLLVRVIEYRITDARLGEPEQIYRLATTWLNPHTAPALDLIDCYHERWEVEVVLDEIKTHQRLQQPVLRSRTPEACDRKSMRCYWPIMRCVRSCIAPPVRLAWTPIASVLPMRSLSCVRRPAS